MGVHGSRHRSVSWVDLSSPREGGQLPENRGPAENSVEWRRLNEHLWAGTRDDGPVGTIEHGRRYYAIDTLGSVIARCPDLAGAQAALAENAATGGSTADPGRPTSMRGKHAARSQAA
jgi:hypothetical protein